MLFPQSMPLLTNGGWQPWALNMKRVGKNRRVNNGHRNKKAMGVVEFARNLVHGWADEVNRSIPPVATATANGLLQHETLARLRETERLLTEALKGDE